MLKMGQHFHICLRSGPRVLTPQRFFTTPQSYTYLSIFISQTTCEVTWSARVKNNFFAVTSEVLVSRELSRIFFFFLLVLDLEPFQFYFHFSKKSEGILFFTFHFSKKVKAIRISLLFLEKKEWNQVRGINSPLSLFPKIVKSQVSISLKILVKFQF